MLPSPNTGGPAADLTGTVARAGVRTVVAVWPTGLAHLGVTVTACERCDAAQACREWVERAPEAIDRLPPFCPNTGELHAARKKLG